MGFLFLLLLLLFVGVMNMFVGGYNLRAQKNEGNIQGDELRANPPIPVLHEMPARPLSALKNLTVILLPHSHDDTGWQRTVDQYYEEYNLCFS